MSRESKWEYFKAIYQRYQHVSKALRRQILDQFCQVCDYHRKYAIRLFNGPPPRKPNRERRRRRAAYAHR